MGDPINPDQIQIQIDNNPRDINLQFSEGIQGFVRGEMKKFPMGGENLGLLGNFQEETKLLSLKENQKYYLQQKKENVQVEILDETAFSAKLAERGISDKFTRAFTYRDELTQQIHVIFCQGYQSNKIVQHELRRVKQVMAGNYSMLQAYF